MFYRFGYTIVPKSGLVEFDGIINDETKEKIIHQFKTVVPFEYDEEYLILHLDRASSNESEFVQFEIKDIVAIYPLSQQAKASVESKIDQRIRLENPIFESILPIIENEIVNKEVEKAISALWLICKIESPVEKYTNNIGLENIFSGLEFRKKGTKANKIQNGNYWEYLIAYDRYDFFPNSILGYFYDAGQVFAYCKGLPTFEGSEIYKFLEKLNSANPSVKLLEIIKYLDKEEQLKAYVSKTIINDIKQYIVAPLYLMLRDEIRKSDDISQTKLFKNLDYLKDFGDSFYYSIILLGAFFGFRKFYDQYYEILNLRFYKDFNKQTEKEEQQEKYDPFSIIVEADEQVIKGQKQNEASNVNEACESSIKLEKDLDEKTEIQTEKNQAAQKVTDLSNSSNNQQIDKKEVTADIETNNEPDSDQTLEKNQILEKILSIINTERGNFEIKTDRFKDLMEILSPLSLSRKILKKVDVARIITDNFSDVIKVEEKRNKQKVRYFIRQK